MFQLTVRGHDLKNYGSPEELAQKIAAQNIHNIQFALNKSFPQWAEPEQLSPGLGRFFKRVFGQSHVQVALLSCYCNLIHPDLEKREAILSRFETYLAHAKYFDAAMVASETGSVLPNMGYTEENFSDAVFDDLVQVIKRLVQVAKRHQVMLGIEAGLNHPLSSIDRIQELLERVPSDYLGIIFDPTNLITAKNYQEQVALTREAFSRFGDAIVCLHLKDYQVIDGKIKVVPLGEGMIDYQQLLAITAEYKPYCYVVLEGTTEDAMQPAISLIEALKK